MWIALLAIPQRQSLSESIKQSHACRQHRSGERELIGRDGCSAQA